jgi:hypothetical protein
MLLFEKCYNVSPASKKGEFATRSNLTRIYTFIKKSDLTIKKTVQKDFIDNLVYCIFR